MTCTCDLWLVTCQCCCVWLHTQANKSYSSIVRYVFPTCFSAKAKFLWSSYTATHKRHTAVYCKSHKAVLLPKYLTRFSHVQVCTQLQDWRRLRAVSRALFLVRRAKRPRHANDHARDWRRETGLARRVFHWVWLCEQCLFFLLGLPP